MTVSRRQSCRCLSSADPSQTTETCRVLPSSGASPLPHPSRPSSASARPISPACPSSQLSSRPPTPTPPAWISDPRGRGWFLAKLKPRSLGASEGAGVRSGLESAGSRWVTAGRGDPPEGVRAATPGARTVGPARPRSSYAPPPGTGRAPYHLRGRSLRCPRRRAARPQKCVCPFPRQLRRPPPRAQTRGASGRPSPGRPVGTAPEPATLFQARDAPGHPDLTRVASKIRSKKEHPRRAHT